MPPRPVLFIVFALVFASCGRDPAPEHATQAALPPFPTENLPSNEAGEVVRRSIDFATGGWENWQSKRNVRYRKTTIQYDENGNERRRIVQHHFYVLHPSPMMRISWEEDGRHHLIINDGEYAKKWIDGQPATSEDDRNHAWNSSYGSHYVFAMPFKLTDQGALLTYKGTVDLPDIGSAHAVQVDYEEGAGSAGGMHTWTYFFSPTDGRLVANHLQYGSGPSDFDYTEYADVKVIDGVRMPTRRFGYRSNVDGHRLGRTSEIFYEDVRFNAPLSSSLFDFDSVSEPALVMSTQPLGGEQDDEFRDAVPTSSGFVAAGWTSSKGSGEKDAWLVRFDPYGTVQSEHTFGGEKTEGLNAVRSVADGGFVAAGYRTADSGTNLDGYLVRIDTTGRTLWEQSFGGDSLDLVEDVAALRDGGFALVGGTRSSGSGKMDMWVVRTAPDGTALWESVHGGIEFDRAISVIEGSDGRLIVLGHSNSGGAGGVDFRLLELSPDGRTLADRFYGSSGNDWSEAVAALPDGGFILAGETMPDTTQWDVYVLRLDAAREVVWERSFGGEKNDWANAALVNDDGSIVLAGVTESKGAGEYDGWVLKLDARGELLWDRPLGGERYDNVHAVLPLPNEEYAVAGRTFSFGSGAEDAWIVTLSERN